MPTDMFYFQSPLQTKIVHKEEYHISGVRTPPRKRHSTRMNSLPQRAMMARFDEPFFCPSNITDLMNQYPIFLSGPAEPSSRAATSHVGTSSDDSDEEDGGVSIREHLDVDMPDAPRPQVAGETSNTQRPVYIGSSVLSLHHPRPDTPDLWAEEDSRRLRFALDGDDIADVPQFVQSDERSSQTVQGTYATNEPGHHPPLDGNQVSTPQELPRTIDPSIINGSRPVQIPTTQDDDLLDVDDPRRSYDVADFVDAWRFRSARDKSLPPLPTSLDPSAGQWWCPPELVIRPNDTISGAVDVQGIRWEDVGTIRKTALNMRKLLHPAQRHDCIRAGGLSKQHLLGSEAAYRFRSFAPQHRAHVCHYQLRNAIAATSRSGIFYANRSRIFSTSLASPSSQNLLMDLSKPQTSAANFRVACLAAHSRSSNLLFAGGFLGEYAMLNLDLDTNSLPIEGFVTHAYNGLVTHIETSISRSAGQPQATFCSNDAKVRILDATTGKWTACFAYAHAVNSSATSADSRLRVLVGDTKDACITAAENGNALVQLRGHTDHAFACAWAPNGIHVATGSQDGKTLVWDARNWSRSCSVLESRLSCPRSLHFADDNTLIVAENEDIVSIYGSGTFEERQDLRFFGSIAGTALLDGGAEIVVANSDKTVGGLLAYEKTGFNGRKGQQTSRVRDMVKPPARKSRSSVLEYVLV